MLLSQIVAIEYETLTLGMFSWICILLTFLSDYVDCLKMITKKECVNTSQEKYVYIHVVIQVR